MAYTDFTLDDLRDKFKVQNKRGQLFPKLKAIKPSEHLKRDLRDAQFLPKRSEKAKSEWVVSPILKELWRKNHQYFTIYSGELLNADANVGLNGECDFILAKETGSYSINYPILHIVEAKKHDLDLGIPQCAAQMFGAKVFNKKMGTDVERIYGCVTTGEDWQFLTLENNFVIDDKIYHLNKLSEVLAVFQYIIDYYKNTLK
jgi:hypothetical protein